MQMLRLHFIKGVCVCLCPELESFIFLLKVNKSIMEQGDGESRGGPGAGGRTGSVQEAGEEAESGHQLLQTLVCRRAEASGVSSGPGRLRSIISEL